VLQKARSAISSTVSIATDGTKQLGEAANIKRFMMGVAQAAPVGPKKAAATSYHDVALLYSQCWLYGPNSALSDGLLKEKLVTLLMLDSACRPSDMWRINRVMSGRHQQIKIDDKAMEIRYFWPKEVVPGSSRSNATGRWFSKWVRIARTVPSVLCTVATMEDFLARTSDPALFATHFIPQLKLHTQSLVHGQKRGGMLARSSVDHISNLVQRNMNDADMGKMTTSHLRGASTSKIVDLAPHLHGEAMSLGRWTTTRTFDNHYYAPLLVSPNPVPSQMRDNPQQVLRWGWSPNSPKGVTATDYEKGPTFWVKKKIKHGARTSTVASFDDGSYSVSCNGATQDFTHENLMSWIGAARSSRHSGS